jgi:hypothetical protein
MEKLTLRKFRQEVSYASKHGGGVKFIQGPLPFDWLAKACLLGGKCASLAFVLWYAHGLGDDPVVLTRRLWGQFGMTRHSAYYALNLMEEAGLIHVERHPGRSPRVTLLRVNNVSTANK